MVSKPSGIDNIPSCHIDISNATAIHGKDLGAVRVKTTRDKPERVREDGLVKVPRDFYTLHSFVTLTADVMFVNSCPFLVTLSRKIQLRTAEHVPNRTAVTLSSSLIKVIKMYARGVSL